MPRKALLLLSTFKTVWSTKRRILAKVWHLRSRIGRGSTQGPSARSRQRKDSNWVGLVVDVRTLILHPWWFLNLRRVRLRRRGHIERTSSDKHCAILIRKPSYSWKQAHIWHHSLSWYVVIRNRKLVTERGARQILCASQAQAASPERQECRSARSAGSPCALPVRLRAGERLVRRRCQCRVTGVFTERGHGTFPRSPGTICLRSRKDRSKPFPLISLVLQLRTPRTSTIDWVTEAIRIHLCLGFRCAS